MARSVTDHERVGTQIRNRRVGTIGIIQGYYPAGGAQLEEKYKKGAYVVYTPAENERYLLPFENLWRWEVMEGRLAPKSPHQAVTGMMVDARHAAGSQPGLVANQLPPLTHCMKCGRPVDESWEGNQCPRCGATYLGMG